MFTNDIPEKELKKLTDAISKAITASNDVKSILSDFHKKNLVDSSVLMFLALNIQNINTLINKVSKKELSKKMLSLPHTPYTKKQFIDGRKVSKNDEKFYEYCMENFNENEWLRAIGIKYY